MLPAGILRFVILCISLLFPVVSSGHQTQGTGYSRRALVQLPGIDKNAIGQANATSPNHNHAVRHTSPSFAHEFLQAHNKVRMNFNQPPLQWDRTLARHARRWGIKRTADCKMIHSYGPYGENLFWGGRDHWTPTEAVESWAREQANYDADKNTCSQGQMCGHYTQIVWRDSSKLGCARIKCLNGGVLIICEYDPPGNFVNESPFGTSNGGGGATATALNTAQTMPSQPSTPNPPSPVKPTTTTT